MFSRFHLQNKVLNIDGVKVKLQVRIYVDSHPTTEYKWHDHTPTTAPTKRLFFSI